MTPPESTVVTRFAPSPTGNLHIGGARTALFCWAFARRSAGTFLIRLEDTDRARSSDASARAILEDLAWLGIDWDEGPAFETSSPNTTPRTLGGDPRNVGPFRQSQRLDIYQRFITQLLEAELAYPAFDTPDELAALRKTAEAEKRTFVYRQPADFHHDRALARAEAEPHVIRFKAPDAPVTVHDQVLGEVTFAAGELDDFVIRKADGFPTYHFACVIDDELMGVTHVLRGQEHLMNSPRHVALQAALTHTDGTPFRTPTYAHMPLIFNEQGAKMSKRERDQAARKAAIDSALSSSPTPKLESARLAGWLADKKQQLQPDELDALADALGITLPEVAVSEFRAAGYLPQTITNFIALLGWTPTKLDDGSDRERFDGHFLSRDFALDRIGKSNARFDRKKLLAFSTDDITTMDPSRFHTALDAWSAEHRPDILRALTAEQRAILFHAVQPQSKTLAEAADRCGFALIDDAAITYDEKAAKKWLLEGEAKGLAMLRDIREALAHHDQWSPSALSAFIEAFCSTRGVGMGQVAQPLRVALTGTAVSPAIGETLASLGKDRTITRLDRCLDAHQTASNT